MSPTPAQLEGSVVLDRLAQRPGGSELLELAQEREDLALIGGAVRDLLLGTVPRELDVTVPDGATALAEALAQRLGEGEARTSAFERFGTARVEWADGCIDIAERRCESYPRPGSLPEVSPGDQKDDLRRRDFTLNAISVALAGPRRGELETVEHGLSDLAAGQLRVLHEESFLDDPTRLMRLARYSARLRFQIEPHTARLAAEALRAGALASVSGARVGAELWLALREAAPLDALAAMEDLGVLSSLGLPAPFDRSLAEEALRVMPADGDRRELVIAVLLRPSTEREGPTRETARALLDRFEIHADARERVLIGSHDADSMLDRLPASPRPSELREVLATAPVESLAIIAALAARRRPELGAALERWLGDLRRLELDIGGEDLLAAGVPQGPEIGRRLARVLDLKLDGELGEGRDAELRAALAGPG